MAGQAIEIKKLLEIIGAKNKEFAAQQGVGNTQAYRWATKGFILVGDELYRPVRKIKLTHKQHLALEIYTDIERMKE